MSVCLVVLCRDNDTGLRRLLKSAAPVVDEYVIVDTGSADRSLAVAKRWLRNHPGTLHERRWHGFAHNRTEALELGRATGCDYLLTLDADHQIDGQFPELGVADEYMVDVVSGNGGLAWRLPLLLRASRTWTYRGAAHAYLCCDDPDPVTVADLDGVKVNGGPGASRDKLERDKAALEKDLARSAFYLARTYDDLGDAPSAIQLYRARASQGGYIEEVFFSHLRAGELLGETVSVADAMPHLQAAALIRPDRAEPLRALANLASSAADKLPQPEGLFIRPHAYKEAA